MFWIIYISTIAVFCLCTYNKKLQSLYIFHVNNPYSIYQYIYVCNRNTARHWLIHIEIVWFQSTLKSSDLISPCWKSHLRPVRLGNCILHRNNKSLFRLHVIFFKCLLIMTDCCFLYLTKRENNISCNQSIEKITQSRCHVRKHIWKIDLLKIIQKSMIRMDVEFLIILFMHYLLFR